MSENTSADQNKTREHLNSLVLAVYKVTELFPPNETLRVRLREQGLNVLSRAEHAYLGDVDYFNKFIASIRTLINYCEVAQRQNWVDERNFIILKKSLHQFLNEMPQYTLFAKNSNRRGDRPKSSLAEANFSPSSEQKSAVKKQSLSRRQKQILQHLQENNTVEIAQLADIVPQVSKRTIRRDLNTLISHGLIQKTGKTNGTIYELV